MNLGDENIRMVLKADRIQETGCANIFLKCCQVVCFKVAFFVRQENHLQ